MCIVLARNTSGKMHRKRLAERGIGNYIYVESTKIEDVSPESRPYDHNRNTCTFTFAYTLSLSLHHLRKLMVFVVVIG